MEGNPVTLRNHRNSPWGKPRSEVFSDGDDLSLFDLNDGYDLGSFDRFGSLGGREFSGIIPRYYSQSRKGKRRRAGA